MRRVKVNQSKFCFNLYFRSLWGSDPKIWYLRSNVVLTYISDLLPKYGFWDLMSTMERVPGQLEVSQHVQKICAPLIILSSQYLLSKTFTNIKVYVQRLANLCQLLWCHSCLWGWSGSPDIDEQTKQRELKWYLHVVQLWKWTKWAWAKQREPKIITKRYLKVIPAHRIVLSSSSGFFRDLLLKYVKNKITHL